MTPPPKIAVLIPAYLEERHIRNVVTEVQKYIAQVWVVDDGSGDRTAEEARTAGAKVIVHVANQGKGAAIKTGFRMLLGEDVEFIVLLDGDGQHRPDEIPVFCTQAKEGVKLVLGNRMADVKSMPFIRRCTNRLMSWWISRRCGQPIPDTQCGFRMLHRDLAAYLLEKTETTAFEFETEMLLVAARSGYDILSVPVSTVYGDETSKIRALRDTIAFLKLMWHS